LLLALLRLPLRLLAAVFHWLDFFTVRYSGRPLIDSSGARHGELDPRQRFVLNNLIRARQASADPATSEIDAPAPATWELVCQRPAGEPEVVVRGVRAFDLTAAGIVYSTGSAVHHRAADGSDTCLCTGARIEQVVALP
jgi:hypothetical protein